MRNRIFLVAILVLAAVSMAFGKPQKLTPTISWELTPSGVLKIEGSGDMPDFKIVETKYWLSKKYDGQVREIHIGEGITKIGDFNFTSQFKGNRMNSLRKVILPTSLKVIDVCAFSDTGVVEVEFSEGLEVIYNGAFRGCYNLKKITLPTTLRSVRDGAFDDCKNLEEVDFAGARACLGGQLFRYDAKLAKISGGVNLLDSDGNPLAAETAAKVFDGSDVTYESLFPKVEEVVDPMARQEANKGGAVPDGKWYQVWTEGGSPYGESNFELTLANHDSNAEYMGVPVPLGYYNYTGEGGENELLAVKTVAPGGVLEFDEYELLYDSLAESEYWSKTGKTCRGVVKYDPETEEVALKIQDYLPMTLKPYPDKVSDANLAKTYVAAIYDIDDEPVGSRSISFEKRGNRILLVSNEIYMNGRIYCNEYALGRVEGKKILFDKSVYEQGGLMGAEEAYEADDYAKLESLMSGGEISEAYFAGGVLLYDGQVYYEADQEE